MEPSDSPSWLVQIYQMTDQGTQAAAADLLSSAGLSVDARTCERGSFLIVECADLADGLRVYEMVMMADQNAELIHSTTGPRSKPLAI